MEPEYLTGSKDKINKFIDQFDVFLFDCDGVLWSGDHLFEGTTQVVEKLRGRGKRLVFVTNNSTKSRADYQKKLTNLGIPASSDDVFSSAYSSAIYIARILQLPPSKRTVFVLGESGIEAELASEGLASMGGTDPKYRRDIQPEDFHSLASGEALDDSVGVVLCGLDFHLNYLKLAYAFHYVTKKDALFLATNSDVTLPNSNALFPGSGACAAPLVAALGSVRKGNGAEPEVLGKPSQKMMDAVASKFQFDRAKACMVGDRLDTDIRFGIEGKLGGTLCVMTGVTRSKDDWAAEGSTRPTAWVDKLGDLAIALS